MRVRGGGQARACVWGCSGDEDPARNSYRPLRQGGSRLYIADGFTVARGDLAMRIPSEN